MNGGCDAQLNFNGVVVGDGMMHMTPNENDTREMTVGNFYYN